MNGKIGGMDIKVVSLNIWHGELLDDVIIFLREQDADIVLLQEVASTPNAARKLRAFEVIQQELGYEFADFAPAARMIRDNNVRIDGNAIFSKFPLKSYTPIFFNEPFSSHHEDTEANAPLFPRNLQHVEATTPLGIMHVFNLQGVWDLDGDNPSPKRRNMSRIIAEQTKGLKRVVVAGDTNAKPTNPAMRVIEDHLVSVFKNELPTSFNIRRKDLKKYPGFATATVDMMYVSPDVKVLARDCPNVDISDHLPLTATLHIS